MKISCTSCGQPVSNDIPEIPVIRAVVMCPDCVQEEALMESRLGEAVEELDRRLSKLREEHEEMKKLSFSHINEPGLARAIEILEGKE